MPGTPAHALGPVCYGQGVVRLALRMTAEIAHGRLRTVKTLTRPVAPSFLPPNSLILHAPHFSPPQSFTPVIH